jgi:hypothetical protein
LRLTIGGKAKTKETVMENKKVVDKRQIKLEDIMKPGYIPFLGGRPERETVICYDDVMNLAIQLNTNDTVEELLKKL